MPQNLYRFYTLSSLMACLLYPTFGTSLSEWSILCFNTFILFYFSDSILRPDTKQD